MALLCEGQDKLEAALGLAPSGAEQDEHLKAAFEEMYRLCLEHLGIRQDVNLYVPRRVYALAQLKTISQSECASEWAIGIAIGTSLDAAEKKNRKRD